MKIGKILCFQDSFILALQQCEAIVLYLSMDLSILDPYKRKQSVRLSEFTNPIDGKCACGCGVLLKGRQKKWASKDCCDNYYYQHSIYIGNTGVIRSAVFDRDKGFCLKCGVYDSEWQADHIIPVYKGGGACGLENFQTLCKECHKEKTKKDLK